MKKLYEEKSGMIYKLFIYQFAMSLLGLFIASPFKGSTLLIAGIFSMLFYFSLVSYAAVEDGQKDFVSAQAGRLEGSPLTGFKYALFSYIPTIIIAFLNCILHFLIPDALSNTFVSILNLIIRFFLMGMYLGIDSGLTNYTVDTVTNQRISSAPEWIRFLSDNGLIFLICLILMPVVCGIAYSLAYKGKIHINTVKKKK